MAKFLPGPNRALGTVKLPDIRNGKVRGALYQYGGVVPSEIDGDLAMTVFGLDSENMAEALANAVNETDNELIKNAFAKAGSTVGLTTPEGEVIPSSERHDSFVQSDSSNSSDGETRSAVLRVQPPDNAATAKSAEESFSKGGDQYRKVSASTYQNNSESAAKSSDAQGILAYINAMLRRPKKGFFLNDFSTSHIVDGYKPDSYDDMLMLSALRQSLANNNASSTANLANLFALATAQASLKGKRLTLKEWADHPELQNYLSLIEPLDAARKANFDADAKLAGNIIRLVNKGFESSEASKELAAKLLENSQRASVDKSFSAADQNIAQEEAAKIFTDPDTFGAAPDPGAPNDTQAKLRTVKVPLGAYIDLNGNVRANPVGLNSGRGISIRNPAGGVTYIPFGIDKLTGKPFADFSSIGIDAAAIQNPEFVNNVTSSMSTEALALLTPVLPYFINAFNDAQSIPGEQGAYLRAILANLFLSSVTEAETQAARALLSDALYNFRQNSFGN